MNTTKRAIIITVIILNILSIALNVYLGVRILMIEPFDRYYVALAIYQFLGCAGYIATAGCLWYSIADKGAHFRRRYNFYMTGVVLCFILNLFSVSSLLLFITFFMTDIVWVKPHDDVYFEKKETKDVNKPVTDKEKERKIAELRKLKEEGKISDEEFNEALFKLL